MSPSESSRREGSPAAALRWRPLSMVGLFAEAEYPGFVLTVIWVAVTGLCIWWPLADNGLLPKGAGFTWNRWDLHLAGTLEVMHFYLPWTLCVCLVMWLGLEWAAFTAYLATLFSTLYKGMPADLAVVNALHNPLAMAVYFLFYCNYQGDYSLRSLRSWLWFILASVTAAFVSSLGSFISEFTGTVQVGGGSLLDAWLGWVPNVVLLSLLTSGPLLLVFSPTVEQLKRRYFPRRREAPYTQQELLLAVSMFALMLVLFLLVDDQWAAARVASMLQLDLPEAARKGLHAEFTTQRTTIWVLALLLAGVSLGGVFFTSRWIARMRNRFDRETREARDAQRRSETNFRNFFENNPAPMMLYDRETGGFVDVNRAAVERYSYSRSEFLEMSVYDIRPKEDVAKARAYLRQRNLAHSTEQDAGEWRHLTKSGELIHAEVRLNSLVMDNRILNLALIHDISPRKLAQAAVERRARELQLLAASSLQIAGARSVEELMQVAANRARELVGANIAVTRIEPGLARAALSERYAGWKDLGKFSDTEEVWSVLVRKRYPQRLTAAQVKAHPEFARFKVRHGGAVDIGALLAVPLMRSDSEFMGALVVADKDGVDFDAEDESILVQLGQLTSAAIESVRLREALQGHMEELERRVIERTAELDESNRELDAFAYSVAHDLRAPLRAMHGFADAVLEDHGPKLDEAGRDYLARIIKAAKSLDTLIQDLLAYSRVGRTKIELEPVPLSELVQEAVAELHQEIDAASAEVETSVPPLTVLAHRVTLKQVLLNLISNALKFVAPGNKPRVRIWAVSRQGMVEICVRDNGIGIAREHRERIFNVFERLHGSEAYPGTGIGLSIVKKGLARMQGEIDVESDGNGTTFNARLKEYRNG